MVQCGRRIAVTMKPRIKRLLVWLVSLLPGSLRNAVQKAYFRKLVRSVSLDDEPDLRVVQKLVSNGDSVVDVGANIGVVARYLSGWVGRTGTVLAIEPVPRTVRLLRVNIESLGLENVRAVHSAVSDVTGTVEMDIPYHERRACYYRAAMSKPEGEWQVKERVAVPCDTLDNLTSALPGPLRFVKCDTEGHELHVLRGARRTIVRWHPAWLIEVSGSPDVPGSPAETLYRLMAGHGYRPYRLDGPRLVERRPGDEAINHFFLTEEQAAAVLGGKYV